MKNRFSTGLIVILGLMVVFAPGRVVGQTDLPKYCLEFPDNLVKNCRFNEGLNNWVPFVEAGAAEVRTINGNACHTINHPCGYISSNGAFVAGVYQQIQVEPNGIYRANVPLILYDSYDKADGGLGRKIGLDPTGGTDSTSPNIVWSEEVWAFDHAHKLVFNELQVQAAAQSNAITLFVRVNNPARVPSPIFQVWFDEVGMVKVGQAVPTDTPAPPTVTFTPTPVPPTATPTPLPSDTPTPVPTDTPTLPPTDTPTPAPPATSPATSTPPSPATSTPPSPATATFTPPPTATPVAPSLRQPAPVLLAPGVIGTGLLCIGGGGFMLLLVVLAGGIVWLYRLGRQDDDM